MTSEFFCRLGSNKGFALFPAEDGSPDSDSKICFVSIMMRIIMLTPDLWRIGIILMICDLGTGLSCRGIVGREGGHIFHDTSSSQC